MKNKSKIAYIQPMVWSFFLAFLLPAIYWNEVHPWVEFLNKWQALFTGFLAICAAIITVDTMIKIDKEQGKRHDDIIKISFKKDRLLLERAFNPQFAQIQDAANRLSPLNDQILKLFEDSRKRCNYLKDQCFKLEAIFEKLDHAFNRDQFKDATPLFDGKLIYLLAETTKDVSKASRFISAIAKHQRDDDGSNRDKAEFEFRQWMEVHEDSALESIDHIDQRLTEIISCFESLSDEYEANIDQTDPDNLLRSLPWDEDQDKDL